MKWPFTSNFIVKNNLIAFDSEDQERVVQQEHIDNFNKWEGNLFAYTHLKIYKLIGKLSSVIGIGSMQAIYNSV